MWSFALIVQSILEVGAYMIFSLLIIYNHDRMSSATLVLRAIILTSLRSIVKEAIVATVPTRKPEIVRLPTS